MAGPGADRRKWRQMRSCCRDGIGATTRRNHTDSRVSPSGRRDARRGRKGVLSRFEGNKETPMNATRTRSHLTAALLCALAFTPTVTRAEDIETRLGTLSFEN